MKKKEVVQNAIIVTTKNSVYELGPVLDETGRRTISCRNKKLTFTEIRKFYPSEGQPMQTEIMDGPNKGQFWTTSRVVKIEEK